MDNRLGKMSQRRNKNCGRKVTMWSFRKTQRILGNLHRNEMVEENEMNKDDRLLH